jgi:hypothetical protein
MLSGAASAHVYDFHVAEPLLNVIQHGGVGKTAQINPAVRDSGEHGIGATEQTVEAELRPRMNQRLVPPKGMSTAYAPRPQTDPCSRFGRSVASIIRCSM